MSSLKRLRVRFVLAFVCLFSGASGTAWAAASDGIWTNNANGYWSTNGNWAGSAIADGAGKTAWFTNNITTAARVITLDGAVASRTLGILHVGDLVTPFLAFNFIATGGGTVTFNNNGATAQFNQRVNAPAQLFGVPVVLAGSLDVNNASAALLSITNGITGSGNLTLAAGAAGGITLSTVSVNPSGSITNSGLGAGATLISGAVGANVTAITQASTGSTLTVSGNLALNSGGKTLANTSNTKALSVTGGVSGPGDLVVNNNAALSDGITIMTGGITNAGRIVNSGAGAGNTLISSAIGTNVTSVTQNSGTSQLTLGGVNSFTGGLFVKAGTVASPSGGNNTSFGAGLVTLGDTNGSANAALVGGLTSGVYTNPIAVASNNTGAAIISNTAACTFKGPIALYTHNLLVAAGAAATITLSGGVTGTGSLTLAAAGSGQIVISNGVVNAAGTITNAGLGTGLTTISGGVGSNVTGITEASTGSALTVSGSLAVNSAGTTLVNNNEGGVKLLTVSGGVMGVGDLVLKNNSAIAAGITLVTTAISNRGQIVNSGAGLGSVLVNAAIGTNVTRVIQDSDSSPLTLQGINSSTGGVFIKSGTVKAYVNGLGSGLVMLGDTNGSANVTLFGFSQATYVAPIAVTSNNTGVATITSDSAAISVSGAVTLYAHDLTLLAPSGRVSLENGLTGVGNLMITNSGAGYVTLLTSPVNHSGTIVNSGTGPTATTISGGVGSNVTALIENSANCPLTIDLVPLTVNSSGTTLANNSPGNAILSVKYGVNGSGDLVLENNSAVSDGITLSDVSRPIVNGGRVVNSGTGSGNTLISTIIGSNVTRVVQNSATSRLVLSGPNTYSGVTAIDSGTLQASNSTGSATGTGAVNVNNGGTLAGSGTISGAVSVNNGGTLAGNVVLSSTVTNIDGGMLSPGVDGTAGGTLTMGNLTWSGGGIVKCEISRIDNNDAGAGVDYDRILVTDTLTSVPDGKKLILRMDSLGQTLSFQTNRNYSLKVMTYGSAVNLDVADVTLDTSAFLVSGSWFVTNVNKAVYVVCMGATSANKNYWTGTGNWSTATNWSLGHAPLTGEDAEFDFRVLAGCTADVVNADLGSLTLSSGYTGTVTCLIKYPGQGSFTNMSITGDCSVNGGVLTHLANSGVAGQSDRLALSVGGNLTVGPAGAINVDQKGFDAQKGPSAGGVSGTATGAGHGGLGSMGTAQGAAGPTYGSIYYPTNLGSGAVGRGGGAVLLKVTGTASVNGPITAKGNSGVCGAAGGSIFIQAAAMDGSGVVDVAGGSGSAYTGGNGGGGRIAVILTNSAAFGAVACRAYGGGSGVAAAGAGTVYLQSAGQAPGGGTMIVDNGNLTSVNPLGACTLINEYDLNTLGALIIRNRGILGINTNTTIDFGAAKIQGAGASVVANWRTASTAPAGASIALRGTNYVTFPNPYVISNYSLCLDIPVSVAGNWVVASNGSLSHSGNLDPVPGAETFRLRLDLAGNLTVEAGGAIEANTKGYWMWRGPAPAATVNGQSQRGASHGGRGGQGTTSTVPLNVYGSARAPRTLGSGGSIYSLNGAVYTPRSGGGSIELVVRGTTTVFGVISVRTSLTNEYRSAGAAGGSVYIQTRFLQGSGSIDAQGDASGSDNSSPGGGGRIAVLLTESESFGDVTFSAAGLPSAVAANPSGPGTVYLERASESGHGRLVVDNADRALVLTNSATQLPVLDYASPGELTPVTLVVSNRAKAELTGNLTMKNLFIYTNSILYLKGYTLTLNSAYHDDWGSASLVVYEGGQILWRPLTGSLIMIR